MTLITYMIRYDDAQRTGSYPQNWWEIRKHIAENMTTTTKKKKKQKKKKVEITRAFTWILAKILGDATNVCLRELRDAVSLRPGPTKSLPSPMVRGASTSSETQWRLWHVANVGTLPWYGQSATAHAETSCNAVITTAIRLQYDYDPTTTHRARLLPFDSSKKMNMPFFRRSRIVVESQLIVICDIGLTDKAAQSRAYVIDQRPEKAVKRVNRPGQIQDYVCRVKAATRYYWLAHVQDDWRWGHERPERTRPDCEEW